MATRTTNGRFAKAIPAQEAIVTQPATCTPAIQPTGTSPADLSALYNTRYANYCRVFPVTCEADLVSANAYAQKGTDERRASVIYNANFSQFVHADQKNLDVSTSLHLAHRYAQRMVRLAH